MGQKVSPRARCPVRRRPRGQLVGRKTRAASDVRRNRRRLTFARLRIGFASGLSAKVATCGEYSLSIMVLESCVCQDHTLVAAIYTSPQAARAIATISNTFGGGFPARS